MHVSSAEQQRLLSALMRGCITRIKYKISYLFLCIESVRIDQYILSAHKVEANFTYFLVTVSRTYGCRARTILRETTFGSSLPPIGNAVMSPIHSYIRYSRFFSFVVYHEHKSFMLQHSLVLKQFKLYLKKQNKKLKSAWEPEEPPTLYSESSQKNRFFRKRRNSHHYCALMRANTIILFCEITWHVFRRHFRNRTFILESNLPEVSYAEGFAAVPCGDGC